MKLHHIFLINESNIQVKCHPWILFLIFLLLKIDVSTSQQCGGLIRNRQGRLYSPGYPRRYYSPNMNCVWQFRIRGTDQVSCTVRDIQMENGPECLKDYLELTSFGAKPQRICGRRPPAAPLTGFGPANISFVTNERINMRGFQLIYMIRPNARPRPPSPCESNPCQNGGRCRPLGMSYKCVCPDTFIGDHCEEAAPAKNYCEPNPCQNGGECTDTGEDFTCACADGWTGKSCDEDVDECESNPCQNGGTCANGENKFDCTCSPGYNGDLCETDIDECESDPCQNGGTCEDGTNEFTCTCAEGYSGDVCDTNVDECASSPCQNGGTCEDGVNEFTCACADGWSGDLCDTNVDECESDPCQNGATCEDEVNGFKCTCTDGYSGDICDTDIDECESSPCQNGGTCKDGVNEFSCDCPENWSGDLCETEAEKEDPCESSPCKNGGTCTSTDEKFTCKCTRDWEGETCEKEVKKYCEPNPCKNKAKCVEKIDDFECKCLAGYRGKSCSVDINECASSPCQNGGTCLDKVNGYECQCKDDSSGNNCEVKKLSSQPAKKEEKVEEVVVGNPLDPCDPSPCLNEAECIDLGDLDFICMCHDGFSGETCEEGEHVCVPNPCQNGGSCTAWGETFICACAPGFLGKDCTTDIDECESSPCADGMVCIDEANGYFCREPCKPGLTGKNCETDIDECESDPCLNGATCEDALNSFKCICASGFLGELCGEKEIPKDLPSPCNSEPCKNGGDCEAKEHNTLFKCQCQIGWKGIMCEIEVSDGCPSPTPGSDGFVPFGASLQITCDPGFDLNGPGKITCLKNGSFDNSLPKCIGNGTAVHGRATKVARSLSPFSISMIACGSIILLAITGLVSYVFFFAPWNKKAKPNSRTKLISRSKKVGANGQATTSSNSKPVTSLTTAAAADKSKDEKEGKQS